MFISRGTTKRRMTRGPSLNVKWRLHYSDGSFAHPTNVSVPTGGTQITESDGNRWPPPKGDFADCGSEFYSLKQEIVNTVFPYSTLYLKAKAGTGFLDSKIDGNFMFANCFGSTGQAFANSQTGFGGPFNKSLLKLQFPPDLSSSRAQLVTKGSVAVAAVAPSNQIANAASAVGELLQDVPAIPGVALWKSRLRALQAVAGLGAEFLNYEFGIAPTISDMTDFYKAVHKVDKRVDQFIRDSGKLVRRKFVFPTERSETLDNLGLVGDYSPACTGSQYNNLYASPSQALPVYNTMRHRVVERKIWFSGGFTYHIPDWYDTNNREDRMRLTAKLLGAQPDLNTVWQLAPWSWAVDWFVNAGTFVKNLQSLISYGTVLRYGYVMETTTITDTFYAGDRINVIDPAGTFYYPPPYPACTPITLRTTVKKRIQANPFGFGLTWDGLSTTQKAIAAALGITRVVR